MIDRMFFGALTFALLLGFTAAVGAALFGLDRPAAHAARAAAAVCALQPARVVAAGHRAAAG
jgi:hypothetical protein